jgi:hypothetical protein
MPLRASRWDKLFGTVFLLLSVGEKRADGLPPTYCYSAMSRQIWRSIAAAPAQADRPLDPARDYRKPDRLAAMNAFAFAAQTKNLWMTWAAITLGIATPGAGVCADARRRRALQLTMPRPCAAGCVVSAPQCVATFAPRAAVIVVIRMSPRRASRTCLANRRGLGRSFEFQN